MAQYFFKLVPTVLTFFLLVVPILLNHPAFGAIKPYDHCQLKCLVPLTMNQYCGSNGVTYFNYDELLCAQKRCYPELTAVHKGKCGLPGKTALEKVQRKAKQKCELLPCSCNFIYAPICGSDGLTYWNECMLTCNAQCKKLKASYPGYCSTAPITFRDDDDLVDDEFFSHGVTEIPRRKILNINAVV